MSIESNKALVERYLHEVFNRRNLAAIDELVAPGAVDHYKQSISTLLFLSAFPDFRLTVRQMIAEGDLVSVVSTLRGSHQGELMGIAPTGKPISIVKADIFRIQHGKIVEVWQNGDFIGLLQQIGAIDERRLAYHIMAKEHLPVSPTAATAATEVRVVASERQN